MINPIRRAWNRSFPSMTFLPAGIVAGMLTTAATAQTLINADFNAGTNGFAYMDDAFRATARPTYASGDHLPTGGSTGGGLRVRVGGVDGNLITNGMSGGWRSTVNLAQLATVRISFRYQLSQTSDCEPEEISQALVTVNGLQPGGSGIDYVAQIAGDGNGGSPITTGWQEFTADLGILPAGNVVVTVGAYMTQKNLSNEETTILIDDLSLTAVPLTSMSGLLREVWTGITGTAVSSLTSSPNYPNNPNTRAVISILEGPTNSADNYGTRLRGYVTPPTTGSYTFWIASDDNSELWLSSSTSPSDIQRIAFVSTWTNPRAWTTFPSQQSAAISLAAGQKYYIEVRQKEGTGGDNLAVGWQGPGITGEAERPIPGIRLTPWSGAPPVSPPAITTQPSNQSVAVGQTATFTVVASGSQPLAYQWLRNGANISGATSASYTTPPATAADSGSQFTVSVSNPEGSVTSAPAVLAVSTPPSITSHPASRTVNQGAIASFSVTAAGSAPLSYQWFRSGAPIAGATGTTYNTPPVAAGDNGATFHVTVSNAVGNVSSNPAVLTVISQPTITTHPQSRSVPSGQTAAFNVSVSGTPPFSYQWRRNGSSIPGATASSYTTPPVGPADNGAQYSVTVTNAAGSVSSSSAVLTVLIPPAITTQPANQTVNAGQAATFTVAATGTSPLSYQWRKQGAAISGATASTYVTPPATVGDDGSRFDVVVSNAAGTVTSAVATLDVSVFTPNNKKLSISGELVDAAGNPVGYPNPAQVDAVVRLMNHATAGATMYTETFLAADSQAVTVEDGLFVARLGEGSTTNDLQQVLAANPQLWVEITVDDGTPDVLLPRVPLTASAYSLGGTPTAGTTGASVIHGQGDPNANGAAGAVGSLYVNDANQTTWIKASKGWSPID